MEIEEVLQFPLIRYTPCPLVVGVQQYPEPCARRFRITVVDEIRFRNAPDYGRLWHLDNENDTSARERAK